MQDLMERADFVRACLEHQPLVIQMQKCSVREDPGTIRRIYMPDHICGICKGKEDWNAVMAGNEQKVTAVFFAVIMAGAASDIKSISIIPFGSFQKAHQGLIGNADLMFWFQITTVLS